MSTIRFDAEKLVGPLNELIKIQLPRATTTALNQALFETRKRLQDEAKQVFSKPVPFTLNSFLYEKPKQVENGLTARIYVRDDAPKGNAPSRYLNPQIRGGPAYQSRFQRAMVDTAVAQIDGRTTQAKQRGTLLRPTASPKVRTPAAKRGAKYPSMTSGQYNQILSSVKGGVSSADFVGQTGPLSSPVNQAYVAIDLEALEHPYWRNRFSSYPRKPGVYKIERYRRGVRYYRVLTEGRIPTYSPKFKFFDLSAKTITDEFTKRLRSQILR
jgi:hypothetical protein